MAPASANNFHLRSVTFHRGSQAYVLWFDYVIGLIAPFLYGIIFHAGLSTGHQTTDYCGVQDPAKAGNKALLEMLAIPVPGTPLVNFSSLSTCHMDQKWLPQLKFLGSYTVPKVDVQIGAAFQSIPGIELMANYAAINKDLARPGADGGPGRLPTGAVSEQATTTVSLIQPGSLYGDRFNQIDLRLGKVLRFGRTRSVVGVDLYRS